MKPLADCPRATLAAIKGVLTDIDETLSTEGGLTAAAYGALEALKKAGFLVIPVTGRPAGWCDHIARFWPVDAVVGENGAFWMWREGRLRTRFVQTDAERAEGRRRLEAVRAEVLRDVPGAAIASDQAAVDSAKLQLTVRSFSDEQREKLIAGIRRVAAAEAMASGLPEDLAPKIKLGEGFTPALINEPGFAEQVIAPLRDRFGETRVVKLPPIMAGEDFSLYRRADPAHIQSLMLWIGGERPETIAAAKRDGKTLPSLHSPFWAPDAEKVIATGAEALASAAMRLMPKT